MTSPSRRHDVDALRVIAIGLLLIYHIAIGFQPWGVMIGFITNSEPITGLWPAMSMLNVWRIPILFYVSGMGVYFALQNRTWTELITERARRILIPFVFGFFAIVPLHIYILQYRYSQDLTYLPSPGHLWFLANIFIYVLLLLPLFYYIKQNEDTKVVIVLKKLFSTLIGLITVIALFMIESLLVNPVVFELYAMTWHGFFLGLIAFFFGYCFMLAGTDFWKMLLQWKWLFLAIAILLYGNRFLAPQMQVHQLLVVLESNFWIFTVFAWSHQYLNKDSELLRYLSQAAYPVYIIHMVVIYLTCLIIFPLDINSWVKFLLVLFITFMGSFALYECIKRVKLLAPLFGMKTVKKELSKDSQNLAGKSEKTLKINLSNQ